MSFKNCVFVAIALHILAGCSCSNGAGVDEGGTGGTGGPGGAGGPGNGSGADGNELPPGNGGDCEVKTCAELGWACGNYVDDCGNITNCAEEGLGCGEGEVCVGGIDSPTECRSGGVDGPCDLCSAIPDCSDQSQRTVLAGRVVTPGRDDEDTANQVGIPNAVVYILRNNDAEQLPAIDEGLPADGNSCDRCEDQDLGPVLAGTVTDSSGHFELEGNVPVGTEFLLVVKAGKFRRAVSMALPDSAACDTTSLPQGLPDNPTRLPRDTDDGVAVHIPRIAISTGQIDAMECVFFKMGLSADEFGNPGDNGTGAARIHLYRGGSSGSPAGAQIDNDTPHDAQLYGDLDRLRSYDITVANCEGPGYDSSGAQRESSGSNVREYVNRGGRMFVSHLSHTWLQENGDLPYAEGTAADTGLSAASSWAGTIDTSTNTGTGAVSLPPYPNASPRVESFAEWLVSENVTTAPEYEFSLTEPRSTSTGPGASSEVFVHLASGSERVQQFSFNTPYGSPEEAACGRVAYSGFHVAASGGGSGAGSPFQTATFPNHCTGTLGNSGVLTDQEKILLYMLFDLGACVGDDPCIPATCEFLGVQCGITADGCGGILNCGPCSGVVR